MALGVPNPTVYPEQYPAQFPGVVSLSNPGTGSPPGPGGIPGGGVVNALPPIIKWGVATLVVGGTAEWLHNHVSPGAGYGLVFIVLLAYAAQPSNAANLTAFFSRLGILSG